MATDLVLVTGAAGFIGYHVSKRLLEQGRAVLGVDNLNDYYDIRLKEARLAELCRFDSFNFERRDLAQREETRALFDHHGPKIVIHLAAQPGVRYSLQNPHAYIESNVVGFTNVLEGCRHGSVDHLVFASSSSVYGANTHVPFSVHDNVDHPVSLYAATKKSNELLAHTYSHLFRLPTTGLRFFTVYGPWGRPDMAPFLFARAILAGRPIDVFNNGLMKRDFTFIDDIATGVIAVAGRAPTPSPDWSSAAPDPSTSNAPYRIYNIGNSDPVPLLRFIELMEHAFNKTVVKRLLPMQPGDVVATFADVEDLARDFGFRPSTSIEDGVARFAEWYKSFAATHDWFSP